MPPWKEDSGHGAGKWRKLWRWPWCHTEIQLHQRQQLPNSDEAASPRIGFSESRSCFPPHPALDPWYTHPQPLGSKLRTPGSVCFSDIFRLPNSFGSLMSATPFPLLGHPDGHHLVSTCLSTWASSAPPRSLLPLPRAGGQDGITQMLCVHTHGLLEMKVPASVSPNDLKVALHLHQRLSKQQGQPHPWDLLAFPTP